MLADHCNCTNVFKRKASESSRLPTEKAGDYEKEMLYALEPQLLDCARASIHNMHGIRLQFQRTCHVELPQLALSRKRIFIDALRGHARSS